MISKEKPSNYRSDVDGLRSVAVLGVLIFHAFPNSFPGGFVGVDIFFVISGFLITGIILDHIKDGSFKYSDFYARRIKRIFPALIIVLTTTLSIGWLILLPHEFRQLGKHIMGGIGFVSNLVFWREAGYFDTFSDQKPLLHLWSLGVEEQFYFAWPLFLVLAHRLRLSLSRTILFMILMSFALNLLMIPKHPTLVFYVPLTRFWEILAGAFLAHLGRSPSANFRNLSEMPNNILSATGTLLIIAGFLILNKTTVFPGWWAIMPTFGTFLIMAAGPDAWINKKVLSNRLMVGIGLISYPLYLWHWPLLSFLNVMEVKTPQTVIRWLLLLLSLFLATLTFLLIERQARRKSNSFAQHLFLVGCGVLAIGSLAWINIITPRSSTKQKIVEISKAYDDWIFPGSFIPVQYEDGTVFIKGESKKKTLFIGDSHIEQYLPRIAKVLSSGSSSLRSAVFSTGEGCPPIPNVIKVNFNHCEGFLKRSISYANRDDVDAVVITGAWLFHIQNEKTFIMKGTEKIFLSKNTQALEVAFSNLENFVRELKSKGKYVYLISDIPEGLEFDPRSMLVRSVTNIQVKKGLGLPKKDVVDRYRFTTSKLKDIADRARAIFLDPIESLCNRDFCDSADGYIPRYKDSGHLRAKYVENQLSFLDQTILAPENVD